MIYSSQNKEIDAGLPEVKKENIKFHGVVVAESLLGGNILIISVKQLCTGTLGEKWK